jgi:hypothetical protein
MVRRLSLLVVLATAFSVFAPLLVAPAHAAQQVEYACIRRGPVSGDYVNVCARLYRESARSYYAYGAMDGTNSEPRLYIDALHLRYIRYGVEHVAARAQAKSGRDYINHRTVTVTFSEYTCEGGLEHARVFAIIGYHIIWQNGQRTPATGQASVRTPWWTCGA